MLTILRILLKSLPKKYKIPSKKSKNTTTKSKKFQGDFCSFFKREKTLRLAKNQNAFLNFFSFFLDFLRVKMLENF